MGWTKHSVEQIVAKLAAVRDARTAGMALSAAIASVGVSQATYFRWRGRYGAVHTERVTMINMLARENARLRRALEQLERASA